MSSFWRLLATAGGLGYLPAPGTWGSVPGLFLGVGFHALYLYLTPILAHRASGLVVLGLFGLCCWIATVAIARVESDWAVHDDPRIVVDEVLGQALVTMWFAPSVSSILGAFCLFRFFDILKPFPVGWVDRVMVSPFATLLDDLIAGGMALVVLWALPYLSAIALTLF